MANAKRRVTRTRSPLERRDVDVAGNRLITPAEMPVRGAYLPHVLSRLINLLNLQLLQHLRLKRLTIGQFRLLQFVDQCDGATISEISSDCVIEQSVVSRIVDQLEQRLMVTRKKNRSNARYVQVFMTTKGHTAVMEMDRIAKKIAAHAESELSKDERAQLVRLLQKVFHKVNTATQPF